MDDQPHMIRNQQIELLRMLADRLERLSVDSQWARRASGLRGNILKVFEQADAGESVAEMRFRLLIDTAFDLLRRAAQDIPDENALPNKKE
jgi:hypothetical protein